MVTTRQQTKLANKAVTGGKIERKGKVKRNKKTKKRRESIDEIPVKPRGKERKTPNDIGNELEEDTCQILVNYGTKNNNWIF